MIVSIVECPKHGKQGTVVIGLPAGNEAPEFKMTYSNGKVRTGLWGQSARPPCSVKWCHRQLAVYLYDA